MFSLTKHDDFFNLNAETFQSLFDGMIPTKGVALTHKRATDAALEFWIDMPGVKKDAIKLSIDKGILTVEAERYDVKGSHSRTVTIDRKYNEDEAEAKLEDGVLYIKMPARSPGKKASKTIEIK